MLTASLNAINDSFEKREPEREPLVRDQTVDVLRGMAIVLVVLGHANRGAIEKGLSSNLNLRFIDFLIYAVHMPVFFYLGGYFTAGSIFSHGKMRYLRSRFSSILIPYLLWSIIFFASSYIMSSFTHINNPVTADDFKSILYRPIHVLWFLYVLFILQAFAVFLQNYARVTFIGAILACAVAYVFGNNIPIIIWKVFSFSPFFFAGVLVRRKLLCAIFWSAIKNYHALLVCAVFFLLGIILYHLNIRNSVDFVTIPLATAGIFAFGALSAVIARASSRTASILGKIGSASLGIYLLHTLILALVPRMLIYTQSDCVINRIVFGTLFGVLGSYFIYKLMIRLNIARFMGVR